MERPGGLSTFEHRRAILGIRGLMAVSYWKYGENILRVRVMGLALGDTISCGGSGHRLSTFRGFRLVADNHNGELGNQRGDGADGGEERSQDGADGSEGHGNLDERVAVLVLYNDALDVALVDQGADLIDEVAAQDMNFFDYIIETHSIRLRPRPAISSQAAQYRPRA